MRFWATLKMFDCANLVSMTCSAASARMGLASWMFVRRSTKSSMDVQTSCSVEVFGRVLGDELWEVRGYRF